MFPLSLFLTMAGGGVHDKGVIIGSRTFSKTFFFVQRYAAQEKKMQDNSCYTIVFLHQLTQCNRAFKKTFSGLILTLSPCGTWPGLYTDWGPGTSPKVFVLCCSL